MNEIDPVEMEERDDAVVKSMCMEFDPDALRLSSKSGQFYKALYLPGELCTVGASTGGFKTMFLCNFAACMAIAKRNVGFIHLQMDSARIIKRIYSILADVKPGELTQEFVKNNQQLMSAIQLISFCDLTLKNSLKGFNDAIHGMVTNECNPIIIDGFDSLKTDSKGTGDVVNTLQTLASGVKTNVWICSQLQRQADGKEIVSANELAFCIDKLSESGVTITLGPRIRGKLATVCVCKNRNQAELNEVYRLALTPSLRLEVQEGDMDISKARPPAAIKYINCDPCDFPAGFDVPVAPGDDEISVAEDSVQPRVGAESGDMPKNTPARDDYTDNELKSENKTGYIPIGRGVFQSRIFTDRNDHNSDYIYWLMDLYQLAAYKRTATTIPGKRTSVTLDRGQVIVSNSTMVGRWNTTPKRVRTFLDTMKSEGLITLRSTPATDAENTPENDANCGAVEDTGGASNGAIKGTTEGTIKGTTEGTTEQGLKKAFTTVVTLCHYH